MDLNKYAIDEYNDVTLPLREALLKTMMKHNSTKTMNEWLEETLKKYDKTDDLNGGSLVYLKYSSNLYNSVLELLSGIKESDSGINYLIFYIDEPYSNNIFSVKIDENSDALLYEIVMLSVYLKIMGVNNVLEAINTHNSRYSKEKKKNPNKEKVSQAVRLINSYKRS